MQYASLASHKRSAYIQSLPQYVPRVCEPLSVLARCTKAARLAKTVVAPVRCRGLLGSPLGECKSASHTITHDALA